MKRHVPWYHKIGSGARRLLSAHPKTPKRNCKKRALFHTKRDFSTLNTRCFRALRRQREKAEPNEWRIDIVIFVIIVVRESVSAVGWVWLRQWTEPCRGNNNGPCRQSRSRTYRCCRMFGSLAGNMLFLQDLFCVCRWA